MSLDTADTTATMKLSYTLQLKFAYIQREIFTQYKFLHTARELLTK